MESTLTPSKPSPTVEPVTAHQLAPFLAGVRRQFLATDVLVFGFLVFVLGWMVLHQIAPGARLYAYDAQFAWAELAVGPMAAEITTYLLIYLGLQRLGVKHHALISAGQQPPRWLAVANIIYVLSPVAFIPFVFNLLGAFLAGVSGVPGVQLHAAYDSTVSYDRAATYWDLWLKHADIAMFGVYPAKWMRQFHAPWLTGVMMVCYLAYYVSPVIAIFPQIARRNWPVVRRTSAIYAGCLLSTYVGYLVMPATGPRFEGGTAAWLPEQAGWFGAHWWAQVINNAEIIRWDAFPSGHVAVALVTLVIALRYHWRFGAGYLPFVAGLVVATVYLGYHYATDVILGFAIAVFTFVVIEPLIRWWESIWAKQPAATIPSAR